MSSDLGQTKQFAVNSWVIHGKKGVAELLGINLSTLRSRMGKLKINKQA